MNIEKKEPVVVIYKLTEEEINYFLSKRDKKNSNIRKRPDRKKKQEASRNLRDVSRVDFTLFENYRRERLKFLNKKARKSKNSPSRQSAKSASPTVEKQKDRPIAPKPNINQLVVHSQGAIPQHFAYAGYPAQLVPLQVFQNRQTTQKDTVVAKKQNNRKRTAPVDSDSDCDENYGIILSGSRDSTFFMHNYACNPSKQILHSFPKQFTAVGATQKVTSISPPDVLINEHDILSAITLDDPVSKVINSTFPNLNSKNLDLSCSDLKSLLISKGTYANNELHGGSLLRQNLLDPGPPPRGSYGPSLTANSLKSGMPDTELNTFTSVVKSKLDGVDLLKEFDVVSKIMLEMDAEFNSAHSKVGPPEHELNSQPKSVQQTPVLPNIALPKGMTLTLVEAAPPKEDTSLIKQGNKETKTATDNSTAKVINCQPKAAQKNDSSVLERAVHDVVRNIVDEVSRKMYIASLSKAGSKLNHLQANKPLKRLCARCKCVFVQDSANRYSCKNCKSLTRVSPKKCEDGLKVGSKNCDKIKTVNVKKMEKVCRTPNKLWKTLSKYDQNRLSYLKQSLSQNQKNRTLALNNSPRKSASPLKEKVNSPKKSISPLKEKVIEKVNNKYFAKKSNSVALKLSRKSFSSLDKKVSVKKHVLMKDAKKKKTLSSVENENNPKSEENSRRMVESSENELGEAAPSQYSEAVTKKGNVEVKNINRGLFLMTFGDRDAEIDMSAGNDLAVDKDNTSKKNSELPEKEATGAEAEKEKGNNVPVEEEEVAVPSENNSSHPLLQNRAFNEISCTYVIPQVPSIIVAKYSSDNSQNGDYLLSSVAHIQQNPPKASLNVVKTSTVPAISGVPANELLTQPGSQTVLQKQICGSSLSEAVPNLNVSPTHQEASNDKVNENVNAAIPSNESDSHPENSRSISEAQKGSSSPRMELSTETSSHSTSSAVKRLQVVVPNDSVIPPGAKSSSDGATPAATEGNQNDSSLLATMKEPLDIRRRNISHELDAVAILSILDLDGSRSRSETLLRSLLDKEFKELKTIRGMKISELDGEMKNIVAIKMNRILDTIKSLQLATVLFRQYDTLDKVVEAVLRKPSAVKESAPPSDVCDPVNEKVLAKLEGRQDCRFASCSVTANTQQDLQNAAGSLNATSLSTNNEPTTGQLGNSNLNSVQNNSRIQCKTEAAAASSCCMQSNAPKAGSAAANYLERIEKQVSSIAPQTANGSQLPAMLQAYRQFPAGVLQSNANSGVVRSMLVQQTPSPVQQMPPSQSPTQQRLPSPMQPAQSPVQRMQSPMQAVQSPLQQVASPVHPAPSPMHPPQSPMQQNHPLSMPTAEDMLRAASNGSNSSRPSSGRPHSTENATMPLSPASIKKEALSAPQCSGTLPPSPAESAPSIANQYSASMSLQPNPFPDDVVYSNGMLIHRQAPPAYTTTTPARSVGPPNRTVPFGSQLPFPNMGNNRFSSGYNPMQAVSNPAVGMSNQVALYNQQMTNSGVRVQQVVLPSSNSNLQQLNKPYTPNQVSGVQGNSYTLQTQSTANIVPATNAMTASSQVVPVQNSLRLAQGSQGTNASSYQTVSQVAQATTQVMQQPNWNKENPSSNGNVMFCALCNNLATLRCKQCTKVAFCNTTCADFHTHECNCEGWFPNGSVLDALSSLFVSSSQHRIDIMLPSSKICGACSSWGHNHFLDGRKIYWHHRHKNECSKPQG